MEARFVILALLAITAMCGAKRIEGDDDDDGEKKKEEEKGKEKEEEEEEEEEEEVSVSEENYSDDEDMTVCLTQENVTEADMKNFLNSVKSYDDNQNLKMAVLCFLKRVNFFDGKNWNMKVIMESLTLNPSMIKAIKECLKKDDQKLEPQERTYQVQKCVLAKEKPK